MSSEDDTHPDLRVGGWVEPYRELPPAHWASAGTELVRHPDFADPEEHLPVSHRRRGAGALVGVLALAVASAVLTVTFLRDGDQANSPVPNAVQLPTGPILPPMTPAGEVSSAPEITVIEATTDDAPAGPVADPVTTAAPTTTSPAAAATPPPATTEPAQPDLVVGRTIGLELIGHPGVRVRHRNFLGRVDYLSAGSSSGDRADSRFVVRSGPAQKGCFSFEAVNFPGYYLRHQNFVIHLEKRDGSALFNADSTFCEVPVTGGFTLRSVNYPSLSISADYNSQLKLTSAATSFVVRPPL